MSKTDIEADGLEAVCRVHSTGVFLSGRACFGAAPGIK